MAEVFVKGFGGISIERWIKQRYGLDGYQAVLKALPAPVKEHFGHFYANHWYPVTLTKMIYQTVRDVFHGNDIQQADAAIIDFGVFLAEDNLHSILRSVMQFFGTPARFLQVFGQLSSLYFRGDNFKVHVHTERVHEGYGAYEVHGLGALTYQNLANVGYVNHTFSKMFQLKNVVVTERGFSKGDYQPDPIFIEITWQPT